MKIKEVKESLKLSQWKSEIEECTKSGLSVAEWCRQRDINIKTYYYRLRRVRENICEYAEQIEQAVVPVKALERLPSSEIKIESDNIKISITENISPDIIEKMIRALKC